jgi:hypothetical protein
MESKPGCVTNALLSFAGMVAIYWVAGVLHIIEGPARYPGVTLTIAGIAAWIIGKSWRASEVDEIIEDRSVFARLTLWALQDGQIPKPFSVYLRPFAADSGLLTPEFGKSFGPTTVFQPRYLQFEEVLANALAHDLPLIGLGEDAEFPGGGRLKVRDKEWKDTVALLIQGATLVILIPSHHEGTFWEAQFLRDSGALGKTVFVMPPEPVSDTFPVATEWETMREKYAQAGIHVPVYTPDGALFRPTATDAIAVRGIVFTARKLRQQVLSFIR